MEIDMHTSPQKNFNRTDLRLYFWKKYNSCLIKIEESHKFLTHCFNMIILVILKGRNWKISGL